MNNRITRAQNYVKDHAPELVTAAASVTVLVVMLRNIDSVNRNIRTAQAAIPLMIEDGRPFTYYPSVGLFYDTPDK